MIASFNIFRGEKMVFTADGQGLWELAGGLLRSLGFSLGLAESCTGGMIAAGITGVAGSSAFFAGGVVAYDNRVKEKLLAVPGGELAEYGAVSAEVARSMAAVAKKIFGTDIGLAATGVAGPGGGTPAKPVGLVYIALEGPGGEIFCRELRLNGSRSEIRSAATAAAMEMLVVFLQRRIVFCR